MYLYIEEREVVNSITHAMCTAARYYQDSILNIMAARDSCVDRRTASSAASELLG